MGWRSLLKSSTRRRAKRDPRNDTARREAGRLVWLGAKAVIEEWNPADDPKATALHHEVLEILGKPRKGDATKIKVVALATAEYDLDLGSYSSLNAAYTAAQRLSALYEDDPACTCATCPVHGQK